MDHCLFLKSINPNASEIYIDATKQKGAFTFPSCLELSFANHLPGQPSVLPFDLACLQTQEGWSPVAPPPERAGHW